ncbi:hypothetical protein AGMMS49959_04730 [Planctomycetales bacterium]|nr:hypothetical protein AGMMS49959_04730 [Planctomycetales bacterium]
MSVFIADIFGEIVKNYSEHALLDLATQRAELDSFDFVEDLALPGGILVQVFSGVPVWGHVVSSLPLARSTAENVVKGLIERWRKHGLPDYAQFDNGLPFAGPPLPDAVGQVVWLCWSLGVVPVFAPPRRFGFQSQVEGYNRRWQEAVWRKEFGFTTLADVRKQSAKFVNADGNDDEKTRCEYRQKIAIK